MSDLFWPGDERAGDLMTQESWLAAMVAVEQAWLDALAGAGVAPGSASLAGLVGGRDLAELATGAESGGNPVLGLVAMLRDRADGPGAAWIHRGLTSQDVVDTGLVLCLRDVATRVRSELRAQAEALVVLADRHRDTLMTGRTLTQAAVPITFGLKAATWLGGILDAAAALDRLAFRAQLGGAAGTLSAARELAHDAATAGGQAVSLAAGAAERLGLAHAAPWHTSRGAVTAVGDAFTACTVAHSACHGPADRSSWLSAEAR